MAVTLAEQIKHFDDWSASYNLMTGLGAASARLTLAGVQDIQGDGATYFGVGDVPYISIVGAANIAAALAALPTTVTPNVYNGLFAAFTSWMKGAYGNTYSTLDSYLIAGNLAAYTAGTTLPALVSPTTATQYYLYNKQVAASNLTPSNVFAPSTAFGTVAVGAGAGAAAYTDSLSIPPANNTNAVKTITITAATGGTFTLTVGGNTTGAISWSATNATLLANITTALNALANIGAGQVVVTAGTLAAGLGTILVTFGGTLSSTTVGAMSATSSLTGGGASVTVAQTIIGGLQGYTPAPGFTATVGGTAVNNTLTLTITGNGWDKYGVPQTARTWTLVVAATSGGLAIAGVTAAATPTVAGDRIGQITGVSGSGAATAGTLTINSTIERVIT